ncbi:hypothetical protein ONZ45_g13804 [Pleurotus djamor]|nr:hypothetical protein ONZ45_g13804 [Pleurotus djamor]
MEPALSSPFHRETAAQRALGIPELLEKILWQVSHTASLASAALVSTGWSEFALDALWYDGVPVRALLGLLASLSWDPDSYEWAFDSIPGPEAWERFPKYSKRVKKFACYEDDTLSLIYLIVSTMKPQGPLLPNLRTLVTDINPQAVVLFGNVSVEEYTLDHEEEREPQRYVRKLRLLLHALPVSMPSLRKLSLAHLAPECHPTAGDIVYALIRMRALATLYLPASVLQHHLVTTLSGFNGIKDLSNHGPHVIGARLPPDLKSDGFASLTTVDLEASYEDACAYIDRAFHLSKLKSIAFESPCEDAPATYVRLIGRIAHRWPSIEKVSIACDFNRPSTDQPPFSTLEPLLACSRLTSLTLRMAAQVAMDDNDYLRLLAALPSLRRLDLHAGARPSHPVPPIRMAILSSIPVHCPNLEDLGIYMDFREPSHPPSQRKAREV